MDRFDLLVSDYLDGALDAEGAAELSRLLEGDPERFRLFVDLVRQAGALSAELGEHDSAGFIRRVLVEAEQGRTGFVRSVMTEVRRPRRVLSRKVAAGLVAASLAIVLGLVFSLNGSRNANAAIAVLVHAGPGARFVRDGVEREARAGLQIRSGDELSSGDEEAARFRYPGEQTEVDMEPRTRLVLLDGPSGKRIELRRGELSAQVAPQPGRRPMVIAAPQARAEVLGTRLKLSAVEDATRLEVEEGRVRLTRSIDGASIDVPARHYSVAEGQAPLTAEPVPPPPTRPPVVTGFSLIQTDTPRHAIPGYETLRDGAVIPLARLSGKRINLQAHTDPPRVGSLLFDYDETPRFNTEIQWPYTLVSGDGRGKKTWIATPGRHTITATPYTGTYGNGVRGEPVTITIQVTDGN